MTKQEKPVLLEIDNVRITRSDAHNLAVERYESVYNPIKKTESNRWVFKGYTGTITSGLKLIHRKELLIDIDSIERFDDYFKLHERATDLLMMKVDDLRGIAK